MQNEGFPATSFQVSVTARSFCFFQLFFTLLLWLPIFYHYQKVAGLSDPEIFRIQTLYYFFFFALEIPTGYLADIIGYRKTLYLSGIVLLISNLIPIFFLTFSGFLAHFFLIALARALASGTAGAYLYEFLEEHDQTSLYKRTEGKARAWGLIGRVLGWSVIGSLMALEISLPYSLTALSALFSVFFAMKLPKLKRIRDRSLNLNLAQVWSKLIRSNQLVLVIFLGTGIFVLARVLEVHLFQPLLKAKNFSVASFGMILAAMSIFEAFFSHQAYQVRKWISDLPAIFILTSAMCLSLVLIVFSGQIGVFLGLLLFAACFGLSFPIQMQLLNEQIPTGFPRATLLSIESMFQRIVCGLAVAGMGGFIEAGQIGWVLLLSSLVAFSATLAIYLLIQFKKTA